MQRDELLSRIRALKPWLASYGVTRVRLFGSHDAAMPDGEVDLMIDLDRPMGLAFLNFQEEVCARLGLRVDLVAEALLAPDIRCLALEDAIEA